MKKELFLLLLLPFASLWSQTTIFSENMGTPTGTAQIWQNAFQNEPALTFGTGDQVNGAYIINGANSSGYPGASGGGNVYFTTTTVVYGFSIEGINATNFSSLSLKYAYRKESASLHGTFSVAYWNGSSWVTLANNASALFNEAANAPTGWYLAKELALPAAAQISGLKLRFIKSGPNPMRIDDVKLTGIEIPPTVINNQVSNITSNAATFAGNVTATAGGSITANGTVYAITAINSAPLLGGTGVTTVATVGPGAGTGIFSNNSGAALSPNVQYSYNAYATKNSTITGYGIVGTFYTLAAIPTAPIVDGVTGTSLNITIGNDNNPSITTYAIYETTTGQYLQADGTLGATAVYQTAAGWATDTVTGLLPVTTYTFQVKAQNGDGVATSAGPSTNATTLVQPTFAQVSPICFGSELMPLPTTSTNGITGVWSPRLNNVTTTTYTFTPNPGQNSSTAALIITVNPEILSTFTEIAPICTGDALTPLPTTSNEGITGTWWPVLDNSVTNTYTFTPDEGQGACAMSATLTITVNTEITPTFLDVDPICSGNILNDLPTTSMEGIAGHWLPALNNEATTTYTFTPNASECATTAEMTITVIPNITPTFPDVTTICSDSSVNILPTISAEGITGTWSPEFNDTKTTTYTFAPEEGQCATSATVTITVIPSVVPTFGEIEPVCSGEDLSDLPTTSINGITGSWSPELDNTVTTTYTFTPDEGQCATTVELTIIINPKTPVFNTVEPICAGDNLNNLPTTSTNGFTGSWSPDLDNTVTTTYTFTPDENQCASAVTLTIVVSQSRPEFLDMAPICAGTLLSDLPTTSTNGMNGTWTLDSNGNYIFTADAGRCNSNPTITIAGTKLTTPIFDPVASIIAGAPLDDLPITSINGVAGTWSPALDNTASTTYTFSPDPGQCATTATLTIWVMDETGGHGLGSINGPESMDSLTIGGGGSNEVGVTAGELSVSPFGAANYNIPIAVPPGINGVQPQMSLTYNSQGGVGMAGYGWNLSGLSAITRIPSTKFHDGLIDPVDFDDNDRFALDGQRLMLKTGTYGAPNSEYETEIFSNIKVTFTGGFFKVEYPDGSKAFYGISSDSKVGTLSYALTYWENPQSVRITYTYTQANYTAYVNAIKYGTVGTSNPINEIQFVYKNRDREEQSYVGGLSIKNNKILSEIKVIGNGLGYRNYLLTHDVVLNYERLMKITEKNGDKTKSYNPTIFEYADGTFSNEITRFTTTNFINGVTYLDGGWTGYSITPATMNFVGEWTVTGDFDGDGDQDFVYDKKLYTKVYDDGSQPVVEDFSSIANINYDLKSRFPIKCLGEYPGNNFRLMNRDAWCYEQYSSPYQSGTTTLTYTVLSKQSASIPISFEYSKQVVVPAARKMIESYTGDFNGDGLTDKLILNNLSTERIHDGNLLFVNLDRRLTTNFTKNLGNISSLHSKPRAMSDTDFSGTLLYVADVNGDGRSDIIVFRGGTINEIAIYSLDSNENLMELWKTPVPFIHKNSGIGDSILYEIVQDGTYFDPITNHDWPNYVSHYYYPIIGDLNGDGKADIILPGFERKVLISTGVSFASEGLSTTFPARKEYNNFLVVDFNSDGKTDVLSFKRESRSSFSLKVISRKAVGSWSSKSKTFGNSLSCVNPILDISPFMVMSSKVYPEKPQLVTMEFFHNIPCLDQFRIGFYTNQNVCSSNKLITSITSGNGVKESITYSPLINGNGVYTSAGQIENYPNFDIANASGIKVVSQIDNWSFENHKRQFYKYHGATSNIEGLGFLGFRSTLRTNWFDHLPNAISNVTKSDISYRGAPTESFSVLGIASPTTSLQPGDPYINRTTFSYNYNGTVNPLLSNKVFKVRNTYSQNFNGLDNSTITDIISDYDPHNLTKRITTIHGNSGSESKIITEDFAYSNLSTTTPYFIGRPLSKTVTTKINPTGDQSVSEEGYAYDNNLLKEIKKRSTNSDETTNYIYEKNEFDPYGNITKKTLSAQNMPDRVSNFVYDTATHRFLTKNIDVAGLVTEYTYDMSKGLVLTEILPSKPGFPIKTAYVYDTWGKKIKTTGYLGSTTSYIFTHTYANTNGGVINTNAGNDGSGSKIILDDLGRKIHDQTKDINGNWPCVSTVYDINDKPTKISQPYFANANGLGSFTVWSEMVYDEYGRLTQSNFLKSNTSEGEKTSYEYDGLSVMESKYNGQKIKTTVKDLFGNIVSLSESEAADVTFTYFANGNLKTSSSGGGTTFITQDGWGRKKSLIEPSAGTYNYTYYPLGELKTVAIDNKGTTSYTLDAFGRLKEESNTGLGEDTTNSTTTYTYDGTSLLTDVSFKDNALANKYTIAYKNTFDNYKRLTSTSEKRTSTEAFKKVDFQFQKFFVLDIFGRPEKEIYLAKDINTNKASGKVIKNTFKNGYKWQIFDGADNTKLWQTNNVNQDGNILTAVLGNGITIANAYNSSGFPTQIKHDKGASNIMILNTQFANIDSNLTNRTINLFTPANWNESPKYDKLDRLTDYNDISGNSKNQGYNNTGTIASNPIGDYAYNDSGPYRVSTITPVDQSPITSAVLNYYTPRTQNIGYNAFNSPVWITETNQENIDFEYNALNGRSVMYYGGIQAAKTARMMRKFYSADGTMEIKRRNVGTTTSNDFVTYIGGDGYTAPVVLKSDGTTQKYFYLHRDYQGSILAITNDSGTVIERRLFDVWGSLIKYKNGVNTTIPITTTGLFLDRGYTGHEHLLGVGLINMNGRIYDPKLHKFLQPDNYVQNPLNTQNYNRYGYCLNNPTKYIDPSGEWGEGWGEAIAAFISMAFYQGAAFNAFGYSYPGNATTPFNPQAQAQPFMVSNYSNTYIDTYNGDSGMGTFISDANNNFGIVDHPYVEDNYSWAMFSQDYSIFMNRTDTFFERNGSVAGEFIASFHPAVALMDAYSGYSTGEDLYGRPMGNTGIALSVISVVPIGKGFKYGKGLLLAEEATAETAYIGTKLEFLFGKATGSIHNITRSTGMLKQLESIGIFDNAVGRSFLNSHLEEVYKSAKGIVQTDGRILRESLIMGPNGGLGVKSYWEGNKLITVILLGGK
jgi:RHS repeat-associated protein